MELYVFFFEKCQKFIFALFFDLAQRCARIRTEKPFKAGVHLQLGQANDPDMVRNRSLNLRSAADQQYLMPGQGFANFKGSEQMSHPQHMLTVKNDFHDRFRVKLGTIKVNLWFNLH